MKKPLALIAFAALSVTLIAANPTTPVPPTIKVPDTPAFGNWIPTNAATPAPKWEYKTFSAAYYDAKEVNEELDKLGDAHWELVAVSVDSGSLKTKYCYFLKRQKAE